MPNVQSVEHGLKVGINFLRGLVVCIIDHYPLGNQRTEISGELNISEKLGRDSRCLNPDFLILHLAALPLCYCTPHPSSNNNPYISII